MNHQSPTGNRTIAKNATMLYLRMFVSMIIGFYTSRVVLKALGVSDYGVYNLVGGFVVLVNMVSTALNGATSRFLTYSLGQGVFKELQKTFSTAVFIHIGLSLLFLVIAETIGLWFVNYQLVIPPERLTAANWVYQAAVISTILGILQVPYNSLIISHERFGIFAAIDILTSCLKLLIAIIVLYSSYDHLILYSLLYAFITVAVIIFYRFYSTHHFQESKLIFQIDWSIFREMIRFSGWTLFGSTSLTLSQQGTNIIFNNFYGTIINAAVGVANQVQAILYSFIGNISAAFNPQIIKQYAQQNYERVDFLINLGAKFSSLMILLVSVPVICEMETLMGWWLVEIPEGAVTICQIALIANFFNSFSPLVYTAISASGYIRNVNIVNGILFIFRLPIAYFLLLWFHSYTLVLIVCLYIPIASSIVYLIILYQYMPMFSIKRFVLKTYIPITLIGSFSLLIGYAITKHATNYLVQFGSVFFVPTCFVIVASYLFILNEREKDIVKSMMKKIIYRRSAE